MSSVRFSNSVRTSMLEQLENPRYCWSILCSALGLYDTHSFGWPFLLKFLCAKNSETICIPIVQNIVFIHKFFNL